MSDLDALRAALADTARAVRPQIIAPGVEAARRTLRRRRAIRAGVSSVLAAALVTLGFTIAVPQHKQPTLDPTPSPSVSSMAVESATPSPGPTSPSPTPSPKPSPSPSRSRLAVAAEQTNVTCPKTIRPKVRNGNADGPVRLTFYLPQSELDRMCPGQKVFISWATYEWLPQGDQFQTDGGGFELSAAMPSLSQSIGAANGGICRGDRYFHAGNTTFPHQLTGGKHLSKATLTDGRSTGIFEQHLEDGTACIAAGEIP